MPGHGGHWETLYPIDEYADTKLRRDLATSRHVGSADCRDVVSETDRTEQVHCLRTQGERMAHQTLVVSDAPSQSNVFFSSYPVILDGATTPLRIERLEPWEWSIEGWVHASVMNGEASICFFDTLFFADTASLQEGDAVQYELAGLAYLLRPLQQRVFEINAGPLWEMEQQRRLQEGESPEYAARPVQVHTTGAAMLLPRDGDACDDAEFQGVVEAMEVFEHDGQQIYRMELVLMRSDDVEFRLPVYASERVLDGYVPRVGEDVQGVMWLQGRCVGADNLLRSKR